MDLVNCIAIWAVMVTSFLYKTGICMLDTTVRSYATLTVCRNIVFPNTSLCLSNSFVTQENDVIQPMTAMYLMYYGILLYVPSIILGPMFGAWSDRSGRVLLMLIPNIGCLLAVILYLLSLIYPEYGRDLFLSATALQGLFCTTTVISMAYNSYVAENASKDDRRWKLSILMGISLLGKCAGSLLSGIFQDYTNIQITLSLTCIFQTCAVLTTVIFVSERVFSTDDHASTPFMFGLSGLKESAQVVCKRRKGNSRSKIIVLCVITMLNSFCCIGETDITVLFIKGKALQWTEATYGYYRAAEQAVKITFLLLIEPLMFLKFTDMQVMIIAVMGGIFRSIWTGFCINSWMMWVSGVLGFMGTAYHLPIIRSILSREVEEDELGKMFALMGSFDVTFRIIGSVVYTTVYANSFNIYPNVAYLVQGLGFSLYLAMILFLKKLLG